MPARMYERHVGGVVTAVRVRVGVFVCAVVALTVAYGGLAWPARFPVYAQTARAAAICDVASTAEIGDILGFAVQDADEASRQAGICLFASRAVSEDGSASYAVVRSADLPRRRAFFAVLERSCAGLPANASAGATCASYPKLAVARDLQAYFAARTNDGTAELVAGLGDAAFATDNALYVRRGSFIVEANVKRSGAFDLARTTSLAALVVERTT